MRRERHRATTRDRVDRQPAAYANKTRKSIACHAMDQSDHGRRTRANAARTNPTRGTGGARRPPDQPVHRDCLPIPRDEARLVSSRRPSHRDASPGNRSVLHPSPVQSAPQHLRRKITTAENRCASAPRDLLGGESYESESRVRRVRVPSHVPVVNRWLHYRRGQQARRHRSPTHIDEAPNRANSWCLLLSS